MYISVYINKFNLRQCVFVKSIAPLRAYLSRSDIRPFLYIYMLYIFIHIDTHIYMYICQ